MNNEQPHFLKGQFEGGFMLRAETAAGEGGSMFIYRGAIRGIEFIYRSEFLEHPAEFAGEKLEKIELDLSELSPSNFPRLFELGAYRIAQAECSAMHEIDGVQYGKISGIIAVDIQQIWPHLGGMRIARNDGSGKRQNWSDGALLGSDINRSSYGPSHHQPPPIVSDTQHTTESEGSASNTPNKTRKNKGNRTHPAIFLIPLLLVLIWIFTKTEWGQHWICLYQKSKLDHELRATQLERQRLNAIINRTKPEMSECGTEEKFSGKSLQQNFTYTLGERSGEVLIVYEMFQIPDRMEVIHDGQLVAMTSGENGFASGHDTLRFNYEYSPSSLNELTIRMIPNEEQSTTEWNFQVICPR